MGEGLKALVSLNVGSFRTGLTVPFCGALHTREDYPTSLSGSLSFGATIKK